MTQRRKLNPHNSHDRTTPAWLETATNLGKAVLIGAAAVSVAGCGPNTSAMAEKPPVPATAPANPSSAPETQSPSEIESVDNYIYTNPSTGEQISREELLEYFTFHEDEYNTSTAQTALINEHFNSLLSKCNSTDEFYEYFIVAIEAWTGMSFEDLMLSDNPMRLWFTGIKSYLEKLIAERAATNNSITFTLEELSQVSVDGITISSSAIATKTGAGAAPQGTIDNKISLEIGWGPDGDTLVIKDIDGFEMTGKQHYA